MDFTELSQIDSFLGLISGQAIDSHIESIGPIYFFQCIVDVFVVAPLHGDF